ncbi:MAG: DUF2341 domain-containing protein [Myxococcales bacterium]|nr:DUF2341 domain-containing protein [Myxococcales bacterium]
MHRTKRTFLPAACLLALALPLGCGDDETTSTGSTTGGESTSETTETSTTGAETSTSTTTNPTTQGPDPSGSETMTASGTTDPTGATTSTTDPTAGTTTDGTTSPITVSATDSESDGTTGPACGPDEEQCDGQCVDPMVDPGNCGGCGIECALDQECLDGACTNLCADDELYCDGACVDPLTDIAHCGGCDQACALDEECQDGVCGAPFPWDKQKTVTISSTNAAQLDDCQVLVTLTPDNFVYADAQANGEDIRFSTDGVMIDIPYWIESWDPQGDSRIWVRAPSIPANDSVDIYLLYGNPDATDAADGDATFEFFDDFEDGDYSAKWDVRGSPTVAEEVGGQLHIQGNSNWEYFRTKAEFTIPVVVHETHIGNGQSTGFVIGDNDSDYRFSWRRSGAVNVGTTYDPDVSGGNSWWNSGYPAIPHASNNAYSYEFAIDLVNDRARVLYVCNTSTGDCNNTPTTLDQGGQPAFAAWKGGFTNYNAANGDVFVDIMFVRKHSDPEPTTTVN